MNQQDNGFRPIFPQYNYDLNSGYSQDENDKYTPTPVKQKENYYFVSPSVAGSPKPAVISSGRVVFLDNENVTPKPNSQNRPAKKESKTSSTIVNFSLVHDDKPNNKDTNQHYPYNDDYKYGPGNNDYQDFNSENYYNSKVPDLLPYQRNNYDNVNPFSSQDFNFDDFFKGFDTFYGGEKEKTTTELIPASIPKSNVEKTTERIRTTTLSDYYYYDEYEDETEKAKENFTTDVVSTTTPQAITSYGTKSKPKEDQYYYDDYEYDNESVTDAQIQKAKTLVHTTEPTTQAIIKITTTSPPTTTFKFIPSTTPPPVYTIRQRIRTTTKTTTRPTQLYNRQKLLTTTDSDLRPDDLTTR